MRAQQDGSVRQLLRLLGKEKTARAAIRSSIDRLNRDEVDAERQLRVGTSLGEMPDVEEDEDSSFEAGILEASEG